MKTNRLFVSLLAVICLALIGCNDMEGSGPGHQLPAEDGTISININRAPKNYELKTGMAFASLTEPSHLRISVFNPETGVKVIEDFQIPQTAQANIRVPAGEGYEVHAITWKEKGVSSFRHLLLKYNMVDGISILPSQQTKVNLVLENIEVNLTVPESGFSGDLVSIPLPSHPALKNFSYLHYSLTPFTSYEFNSNVYSGWSPFEFNLPSTESPAILYIRTEHFIADYFIKGNEWTGYKFYSPGFDSIELLPPSGSIDIGIQY